MNKVYYVAKHDDEYLSYVLTWHPDVMKARPFYTINEAKKLVRRHLIVGEEFQIIKIDLNVTETVVK